MTRTSGDIRRQFVAFFRDRGHTPVGSSSLLPADDPTLLFTNAGMNQFKGLFLGTETPPYARAVNSQKCIRAGGKHNDLEDVGHDTYHHTFFEMLGNWSFGDYFKAEAIAWAWELLTAVWHLPADRLHATVFAGDEAEGLAGDDESAELWRARTGIDPDHVHRGGKKDNFWEMGETGPCGPCSEIHIDLTPDGTGGGLVNAGDGRVIEIWNLVFIEYNRGPDGRLSPLPARHVDTGMGLERLAAVLQGKATNYATDLFVPLIRRIETFTPHRYGAAAGLDDRFEVAGEQDPGDVACRVIADHARSLTFAIADGILPSNEGRGYVLRRILRRAVRYGRQHLGIDGVFLAELVPTVVELMGEAFGELIARQEVAAETIRGEEEAFGRTLDRGIELFAQHAEKLRRAGKTVLPGELAFDLYATYGFPIDLTQIMAAEANLQVDMAGYERAMDEHRQTSSAGAEAFKVEAVANLPPTDDSAKYAPGPLAARVLGWVADGRYVQAGELPPGAEAAVVLDRTNFYAEQGGQVGDTGRLAFEAGGFGVRQTLPAGECVLHVGAVEAGTLRAGMQVTAEVDPARADTARNHTATHLLNWALREVLGEKVHQAGSVVAPDRLRFDFTHSRAVTAEQLAEIERLANERVLADEPVSVQWVPLERARAIPGVRAVFGEKYPDPVRVVAVGTDDPLARPHKACAIEFCGGTHLGRTGQIGLLKVLSEESVSKGVRRITAVTGRAALAHVQQTEAVVRSAAAALRVGAEEVPARIAAMQKEIKQLRKGGSAGGRTIERIDRIDTPHGPIVIARTDADEPGAIRSLCDAERQKGAAGVFIGSAAAGKVTLVAMVSQALVDAAGVKAGDWVKAVAGVVGGAGGGKPTLAQAGGKQPEKLGEALRAAGEWARRAAG
jgi:alanyl-tRNA synthetase